jgi:hypothetical protein
MPIQLSRDFLIELGLSHLSRAQQEKLLARVYKVLEMRVGAVLGSSLTARQLDEFEAYIEAGDEARGVAFFESNVPEYSAVVQRELAHISLYISTRLAQASSAAEGTVDY